MNFGIIKKTDIANGPGVRVSLFVSGCRNNCPGCFNKAAQDFDYGNYYDPIYTANEIVNALNKDYISGLSILGGEPIEPENVKEVIALCTIVKRLYPNKTIWLYTGFTWEYVRVNHPELLRYVDVLVDGPFIEYLKNISLVFRGSSNQRIIDVQKSLELNYPVEVMI